ncbi:MAG: elongation factor G [Planctomycetes bacterium]|nr:elongation factor G [Planctomycetota bacterium]
MAKYVTADIRNIVLVGHAGTGKTTLADMMLHKAGVTPKPGKPSEGSSLFDFLPEEQDKGSAAAAIAHCTWKGREINIIDTAGRLDFIGTVVSSLAAAETAVIVISATAGIEVNTRRAWERAQNAGVAKIIALNKMDGENVDLSALIADIQRQFGKQCAPLTLPVGTGAQFSGVVNVLTADSIPDGVVGDTKDAKQTVMEAVVEADDALLEKYLAEEEISAEEINAAFVRALTAGTCVPIICCSAETGEGVTELMDIIASFAPSPAEGVHRKIASPEGEEAAESAPISDGVFRAQAFKTIIDDYAGKIVFFRVHSGTLSGGTNVFVTRNGESVKIAQLLRPMGKDMDPVETAIEGDIVAATKLDEVSVSDTLSAKREPLAFAAIDFPLPMVGLAVEPETQKDEQKISGALAKLAEEDPTFAVERNAQTHEMVISGMSNLHLILMLNRMKNRFQVGVITKDPKISYRETVTTLGNGKYRHKKQTGGRGQFGEVWLKVEPLERGNRFEFVDEIYGGAIPNQYLPAVQKGVLEAMEKGIVAGYPVHDVRVRVYDGKHHAVDSSEAAFKIAAARAFKAAFLAAKPMLLEPIVMAEITVPNKFTGDILGDLNSRRGRIQNQTALGDMQVITAEIPMAEMAKYSTQLDSVTGGQGTYTMEFSHYDFVPQRIADGIIAKAKPSAGDDDE